MILKLALSLPKKRCDPAVSQTRSGSCCNELHTRKQGVCVTRQSCWEFICVT